MHDPDIEMVVAKAGDMDDERDPWEEPQPRVRVISPEDGQEGSQELQNLPGPTNLSREQVRACKQVEERQVGVAAGVMGRFGKEQEWTQCFQEFPWMLSVPRHFFLISVIKKIIHLCPSAMKASSLRTGEKGILSSLYDARFNLLQVNALTADLPTGTLPKDTSYFRI